EFMRVFQSHVAAAVIRAQARIVERRVELRGGISLYAIDECAFEGEILVIDGAEKAAEAVLVFFVRDAVVLRRRIKLRVEQILGAIAVVERPGEHELQAVGELLSERDPAGPGIETP